jgi:hypothetical protein
LNPIPSNSILHWHNAPAINPNGLQLIQQRIIDQYGHNVRISLVFRARHYNTQLEPAIPQQSQSAWNIQIRTHRPGIAPANQVEQKQPEILTTVAFPRSSTVYEQDVVFSIITYIVPGQNGTSNHPNTNGMPLSREWEIQKDPTYQAFIDRMKSNHSPFLLPPTVAKEGEFRNVANMTAATSHRQAKLGQGGQQAGQTVLTPGHTLSIEGVKIELDLNPGSKSAGLGGQAEWVVRMGWVGGAPNPLSAGSGQGSTKGIIVEVSICTEFVCEYLLLKEPCVSLGGIRTSSFHASR